MKKFILFFAVFAFITSCKDNTVTKEETKIETQVASEELVYESFGAKINGEKALATAKMSEQYKNMKVGDTMTISFSANVNSVCKKKGCWMRLDLGEEKEAMVRFKDYGFFMPKDIDGREVVVEGKAYVEETSVEDLKHFAKDAGKSEEEIAAITTAKSTYTFIADGVLLKKL